jgi:hypothetical protein
MKHLPLRECGYAIVFFIVLLALYGGAYLAMMQRFETGISAMGEEETPFVEYRFGGESSDTFFGPAHELDRQLRPDLWKGELDVEVRRQFREWGVVYTY